METLGQYIRQLREKKDLSLRELAKKLKITPAFLSDIELGRRYPSNEVLSKIAKELGTTSENLKKYDTRVPVEEMKKLAATNPLYGLAFRKVTEGKISPEKLIDLAKKETKEKKKK